MPDTLDLHTELAALNRRINALTTAVTHNAFHSYEAGFNAHGELSSLLHRAHVLTREAAMEDQRLRRLADAVRIVGDTELGFIAYVVFGPAALPVEPLYEVRLIDRDGYTVADSVRTNLPEGRVAKAEEHLLTKVAPAHARIWGVRCTGYRVQITPF